VFKTTAGATVRQHIPLTFTPCHFGKERPWFACPQCGRRSGLLYVVTDPAFSCRKCCCLRYAAKSESRGRRGLNAARKIRTSLGGGPNLYDAFPRRPAKAASALATDCGESIVDHQAGRQSFSWRHRRSAELIPILVKKLPFCNKFRAIISQLADLDDQVRAAP
jgi:hypothetical protein